MVFDLRGFTIVSVAITGGLLLMVVLIRTLRRQSYRAWSAPSRVAWFGLVGVLVTFGAIGLVANSVIKWGGPATIWIFGALIARGAWGAYRDTITAPPASRP